MYGPGHQFLARARFAGNEHGGAAYGHPVHDGERVADGFGFADDVMGAVAFLQRFLQQLVLPVRLGKFHGVVHGKQQLVVGEGFGDVVEGAVAHGFHRAFDAAEGRHDEHGQVGPGFFDALQHFLAGELGHLHVGDDHVHFRLVQKLQGHFRVVERRYLIARVLEQRLHDDEIVFFVVDDENVGYVTHGSFLVRLKYAARGNGR